jgi:IS66 Orf2 like protein
MIPVPSGVRIWIATGHADMRKGMAGLSLLVQGHFKRDPFLCVGRDYVAEAAGRLARAGRAALPPPHNI